MELPEKISKLLKNKDQLKFCLFIEGRIQKEIDMPETESALKKLWEEFSLTLKDKNNFKALIKIRTNTQDVIFTFGANQNGQIIEIL